MASLTEIAAAKEFYHKLHIKGYLLKPSECEITINFSLTLSQKKKKKRGKFAEIPTELQHLFGTEISGEMYSKMLTEETTIYRAFCFVYFFP